MPIIDALFVSLLVFLILFVVLLSVATLYFILTMRDLHVAVHEMRGRIHHLTGMLNDFRSLVESRFGAHARKLRR